MKAILFKKIRKQSTDRPSTLALNLDDAARQLADTALAYAKAVESVSGSEAQRVLDAAVVSKARDELEFRAHVFVRKSDLCARAQEDEASKEAERKRT